jgi:hypothetical protein
MPELGAALDRLGMEAAIIQLSPAQEQHVRELVRELESIYSQAKQKLAS